MACSVHCPSKLADSWQPGDTHLLHAARMQAREGFNNLRSAKAASDEAAQGIAHAEGVAKLLRHNIVQGQKIEGKDALRKLQFREWQNVR